jgi:putative DNA primase/helicase
LLRHAKNNLAPKRQGLAYRLEQTVLDSGIVASRLVWDSKPVTVSADEALAAEAEGKQQTALTKGIEFLKGLLAKGPVPHKQVKENVEAAGFSWATIKRAKQAAGIDHFREGGLADKGEWLWRLPQGSNPENANWITKDLTGSVSRTGQLGEFDPVKGNGGAEP